MFSLRFLLISLLLSASILFPSSPARAAVFEYEGGNAHIAALVASTQVPNTEVPASLTSDELTALCATLLTEAPLARANIGRAHRAILDGNLDFEVGGNAYSCGPNNFITTESQPPSVVLALPAIVNITFNPAAPAAGDEVTATATYTDPSGISRSGWGWDIHSGIGIIADTESTGIATGLSHSTTFTMPSGRIMAVHSVTSDNGSAPSAATTRLIFLDPAPAAPAPAPAVALTRTITVTEGDAVTLAATVTRPTGDTTSDLAYAWAQLSDASRVATVVTAGAISLTNASGAVRAGGDASATFTAPSVAATDVYHFRLSATAARNGVDGGVTTELVTVIVQDSAAVATPVAPTVTVPAAFTVDEGATVTITGSVTHGGADTTSRLTYQWDHNVSRFAARPWLFVPDGNTATPVGTGGAAVATFTAASVTADTDYSLRLQGIARRPDGSGQVITRQNVVVTVRNLTDNTAPVANAGADFTATVGETVTLSGRASRGAGDTASALTYRWEQIPNATSIRPLLATSNSYAGGIHNAVGSISGGSGDAIATFTAPATLPAAPNNVAFFRLIVTATADGVAASHHFDRVTVTVNPPPVPAPTVTAASTSGDESRSITVSGTVQRGAGDTNSALTYEWVQVTAADGATETDAADALTLSDASGSVAGDGAANFSFTAPAVTANTDYFFRLTATAAISGRDSGEATAVATVTVNNLLDLPALTVTPGADITADEGALDADGALTTLAVHNLSASHAIADTNAAAAYQWRQVNGADPAASGYGPTGSVTISGDTTNAASFSFDSPGRSTLFFEVAVTATRSGYNDLVERAVVTATIRDVEPPVVSSEIALFDQFDSPQGTAPPPGAYSGPWRLRIPNPGDPDGAAGLAGLQRAWSVDISANDTPPTLASLTARGFSPTAANQNINFDFTSAPNRYVHYVFTVTFTDGGGNTASDSITVTIRINQNLTRPNAGPAQTVDVGTLVTLDGTASVNAGGQNNDDLTYFWVQTADASSTAALPNTHGDYVQLSDSSVAQPTFTAPPTVTTLHFYLTVQDSITQHNIQASIRNSRTTVTTRLASRAATVTRVDAAGNAIAVPEEIDEGQRLRFKFTIAGGGARTAAIAVGGSFGTTAATGDDDADLTDFCTTDSTSGAIAALSELSFTGSIPTTASELIVDGPWICADTTAENAEPFTVAFTASGDDITEASTTLGTITINPPPAPAPTVSVGSVAAVNEGAEVTLTGTVTAAAGDTTSAITYAWAQVTDATGAIAVGDGGIAVDPASGTPGANGAISGTFTAPSVTADSDIFFRLTGTAARAGFPDGSATAVVTVSINDLPEAAVPVITGASDQTLGEGDLLTINANITHGEGDAGSNLRWSVQHVQNALGAPFPGRFNANRFFATALVDVPADGNISFNYIPPAITEDTTYYVRLFAEARLAIPGEPDSKAENGVIIRFDYTALPDSPLPTANAGADQSGIAAAATITLSGTVARNSADTTSALTYLWEQVNTPVLAFALTLPTTAPNYAGPITGATGTVATDGTATATLTAPTLTSGETFYFRLTGIAKQPGSSRVRHSDIVNVGVNATTVTVTGELALSATVTDLTAPEGTFASGALTLSDLTLTVDAVKGDDAATADVDESDADTTLAYAWRQVNGDDPDAQGYAAASTAGAITNPTISGATFQFDSPGSTALYFEVVVTASRADYDDVSVTEVLTVTVTDVEPPAIGQMVVAFGINELLPGGGATTNERPFGEDGSGIIFRAPAATDPDVGGTAGLTYAWSYTKDPASAPDIVVAQDPVTPHHANINNIFPDVPVAARAHTYTIIITATDAGGNTATDEHRLVVRDDDGTATADAGGAFRAATGATVTLGGDGNRNSGGTSDVGLNYAWIQTADNTATTAIAAGDAAAVTLSAANVAAPTFTAPASPAVLHFYLVVTDQLSGITANARAEVTIAAPTIPPATLAITDVTAAEGTFADGALTLATHNLAVTASVADDPITPQDDSTATLSYIWRQVNGNNRDADAYATVTSSDGNYAGAITDSTAATASFSVDVPGQSTFYFEVQVTASLAGSGLPDSTAVGILTAVISDAEPPTFTIFGTAPGAITVSEGTSLAEGTTIRWDFADLQDDGRTAQTAAVYTPVWSITPPLTITTQGARRTITLPDVDIAARGVTYTMTAEITDAQGNTGSRSITFTAQDDDGTATADAGLTRQVNFGAEVTLGGDGNRNSGGVNADGLTYAWIQTTSATTTIPLVDGDNNYVALSAANVAAPTFTAPSSRATLHFRLTVTDDLSGITASNRVAITPVSSTSAPGAPTIVVADQAVNANQRSYLTARVTRHADDADGILTYEWFRVAGDGDSVRHASQPAALDGSGTVAADGTALAVFAGSAVSQTEIWYFRIEATSTRPGTTTASSTAFAYVAVTVNAVSTASATPPTATIISGNLTGVVEGTTLSLRGTVFPASTEHDRLTYRWRQVVSLINPATPDIGGIIGTIDNAEGFVPGNSEVNASIDLGQVDSPRTVYFQLTGTASEDGKRDASHSVTISVGVVDATAPTPTANAGDDVTVDENSGGITLNGTVALAAGDTTSELRYRWEQVTDETGTTLVATDADNYLSGADDRGTASGGNAPNRFNAPSDVDANTDYFFRLTAVATRRSNNDGEHTDVMKLTVVHVPVPETPPAPTVFSGNNQRVVEGTTVTLSGTVTRGAGDTDSNLSYSWLQYADATAALSLGRFDNPISFLQTARNAGTVTTEGQQVTITGQFTAPDVDADTVLYFALQIQARRPGASGSGDGTGNRLTVTVTNPQAPAPTAAAGNDQTGASSVTERATITLAGTVTAAASDTTSTLTYAWAQVTSETNHTVITSGDAFAGAITLSESGGSVGAGGAAGATLTAPSVDADTTYYFQLSGIASQPSLADAIAMDIVAVEVTDAGAIVAPTVAVDNATVNVNDGDAVTLAGSVSGGTGALTYTWLQVDAANDAAAAVASPIALTANSGTPGSDGTADATFTAPNEITSSTYHFRLTGAGSGETATAYTSVTVTDDDAPTVVWLIGLSDLDQNLAEGESDDYSLTPTITNSDGDAHTCAFTAAPASPAFPFTEPTECGGTDYATPAIPTAARAITYTITLTVTDTNGLSDTVTTSVKVRDTDGSATADAGADDSVETATEVSLHGSGSRNSGGSDGTGLEYDWLQVTADASNTDYSGPLGVTLNGFNTVSPTFTAPATAGVLYFRLRVTDPLSESTASDWVAITVTAPLPDLSAPTLTASDFTAVEGTLDSDNALTLSAHTLAVTAAVADDPATTGVNESDAATTFTYAWRQITSATDTADATANVVTLSNAATAAAGFQFDSPTSTALYFQVTVNAARSGYDAPDPGHRHRHRHHHRR